MLMPLLENPLTIQNRRAQALKRMFMDRVKKNR